LLVSLPAWLQIFINLFLVVILVVFYAFFVWKFYTSIAKKNVLGLDLNKYNKSQRPTLTKMLAGSFYFIEYIIILPFVVFLWFSILSLFLIMLTDLSVQTILLISTVIVVATRMAAYYKESLAQDIGKLIPFTLLAIAVLTPNFSSFQRILENFQGLPTFVNYIFIYLLFIIVFEVILRFFDFVISLFGFEEETPEEESEKTAE
jgi:hypothetical protein